MRDRLEALLLVQEQDTTLDQLRHRRAALPERSRLEEVRTRLAALEAEATGVRRRQEEVGAEERRLDDEARTVGARADEVEQRLYSGTVSSPRELQAMQADLEMLRRQRSEIEDRELERMEVREGLDAQLAELDGRCDAERADERQLRDAIAGAEAEIDAEIAREESVRAGHAEAVGAELLADYERRRARNRGFGAARLVGLTCQACRLTIPATEADRLRRSPDEVGACDNCGAIVVPS